MYLIFSAVSFAANRTSYEPGRFLIIVWGRRERVCVCSIEKLLPDSRIYYNEPQTDLVV